MMEINDAIKKSSEVSQKYAASEKISKDEDWYILKLQEELGELVQCHLALTGRARLKGKSQEELEKEFSYELADVIGQAFLIANHKKIDVEKVLKEKWFKYL